MADRYYGCEFGAQNVADVTEGSSSTATLDVEVRVTYTATANSKLHTLLALDLLKRKLLEEPWPLA